MNEPKASSPRAEASLLLDLYRTMVLCRQFEEAAAKAYAQGKIGGFCHLYIGQEAVGTGAIAALEPQDKVFASYRDHAQFIARGGDPKLAMAELFGKGTGCSKGLGGSMHFFDAEKGFLGGWGIVGEQVPLATGAAFAAKYSGNRGVSLCFFGEGATNQGAFHEGMTLAKLWKLPAIFLCENNHYAMGTPLERGHAIRDLTHLAQAYDMNSDRIEEGSDDVLVIRERVKKAVDRARAGEGPTFIEVVTYRYRGHSMSDPAKYRSKEEVEMWRQSRDPLTRARGHLLERGVDEKALAKVETDIEKQMEEVVRFAEESPVPDLEEMDRWVYATPLS